MRDKIPQLERALEGRVTGHHRFLFRLLWKELASLEEMIAELQVKDRGKHATQRGQLTKLDEVPGVDASVGRWCWPR